MTNDETRETIDADIGRILEMYHCGYIGLDKLKKNLAQFFGDPEEPRLHTDLFAYLNRVIDQSRLGEISAEALRTDLVRMAVLAKTNDAHFVDNIWSDRGETP